MSIIKLGGCNGSGKTTVARALMKHVGGMREEPYMLTSGKKTKLYRACYSNIELFVLGKYETACGGMDTISDKFDRYDMIQDISQRDAKHRIVFFEGLITGKTYGALGDLSEQHLKRKIPWLYAFMDTPFDVCVERVLQRRAAAGNDAPFDPDRTMTPTFNSLQRLEQKLKDGTLHPHPTFRVAHTLKPETAAKQLLNAALEMHHAI